MSSYTSAVRHRLIVVFLFSALVACTNRAIYEWNLKHACVTPWTHLSKSDREEIIRIISRDNVNPIMGITEHRPWDDGSTVSVFTGNTYRNDNSFWTGYSLKKENGQWRVTFFGDSSPIIAQLALSEQGHELEERRQ